MITTKEQAREALVLVMVEIDEAKERGWRDEDYKKIEE